MKKTQASVFLALFVSMGMAYANTDIQSLSSASPNNSYVLNVVFPALSDQTGEAYNMQIVGSYVRDGYTWSIPQDSVMKYPGENFLWSITSTGTVTSVTMSLNNIQHRNSTQDSFTTKSITDNSCKNMVFQANVPVGVIDVSYDAGTDTYTCRKI